MAAVAVVEADLSRVMRMRIVLTVRTLLMSPCCKSLSRANSSDVERGSN